MGLRKRAIGDLYLAASIIFIYLAFLYFGFKGKGLAFFVIGLALALFGIRTKNVMTTNERIAKPKPRGKRSKKKG